MVGRIVRGALLSLGLAAAVACGGGDGAGDEGQGPIGNARPETVADAPPPDDSKWAEVDELRERPWEVVSKKGETFLANVFYADATENEQIMPTAIDSRNVIDRLVYPTIGNPNLFDKSDAADELVTVLRIEPDAFAHLAPKTKPAADARPAELELVSNDADGFRFFLAARAARAAAESSSAMPARSGVFEIKPTGVFVNAEPADMPPALKKRRTLRFVFDRAAMAAVPAGLYDVRFEVRKGGAIYGGVKEWQYNAVRVFDRAADAYSVINVTDSQASIGSFYETLTSDKLDEFVTNVNTSADAEVKNAAFITFNGDLHNGGSPGSIRQRAVATTYNGEAKRILSALKRLDYPIFLTAGNHDGYAATGHAPSAVVTADRILGDNMEKVIASQNNLAWPGYTWPDYSAWLTAHADTPGGVHRDIVTGGFTRSPADTFAASFREVPRADRNMLLYDGFYQWQRTYGPLYTSWKHGRNRYVSLNTFDLRQHSRSGWGMYTVNYGGNVGREQMAWLDRELGRAKLADEDVVMLMHHDPRGGHKGEDHGFFFPVLEFKGMAQSTINYLMSEIFTPAVCSKPDLSMSVDERDSCHHDGLQEWMAPDPELDQVTPGRFWQSGTELLQRIAKSPNVRTVVMGHAHYNTLEVMRGGDTLLKGRVDMPNDRELVMLRMISVANLTSQTHEGQKAYGYVVMGVDKVAAGAPGLVSRIKYFARDGNGFSFVSDVTIDRTKHLDARGPDNPVDRLFDW
ncbi:MAG: metallophosphoesterase [Myxococcales bacterium]|nr:metallophosphoesterase [Myxococcales bacterium]